MVEVSVMWTPQFACINSRVDVADAGYTVAEDNRFREVCHFLSNALSRVAKSSPLLYQ